MRPVSPADASAQPNRTIDATPTLPCGLPSLLRADRRRSGIRALRSKIKGIRAKVLKEKNGSGGIKPLPKKSVLESLDGFIVRPQWELKRKFLISHLYLFYWLTSCLRLLLSQRLRKPKPLSVGGSLMTVLAPRPPTPPVTATPPPWSMVSAGSREKSAMPFLRMRHVGSMSAFPRLTSAARRQLLSHSGRTGPTRRSGDMRCLKPPRITPIPLPVLASFQTMPPATAFRPPYVATSDMWRTATTNPLLEYGTTSRLFLIRARQEETK